MWLPGAEAGATPSVQVLSFDELAAGKLLALLDRAAPRDAWDAARLYEISEVGWPTDRSRRIFVAMAGALPHPLYSYAETGLSRISDRDVGNLLHPLLIRGYKPSAGELQQAAWAVLAPLLDLRPEEREFSERLQKGELAPELLFPEDPELSARVAESPPLQWKAHNARAHGSRTR